jgi:hypothetical protein
MKALIATLVLSGFVFSGCAVELRRTANDQIVEESLPVTPVDPETQPVLPFQLERPVLQFGPNAAVPFIMNGQWIDGIRAFYFDVPEGASQTIVPVLQQGSAVTRCVGLPITTWSASVSVNAQCHLMIPALTAGQGYHVIRVFPHACDPDEPSNCVSGDEHRVFVRYVPDFSTTNTNSLGNL